VSPNNGVKINNRYYWANAFRNAEVANTKVPVRYDPYDVGHAYAFVKGSWVICHSEHYHIFRGRTEREMMLASSELRKRQSRSVGISKASAKQLAMFIASLESQEALLGQRLRDIETKKVLSAMDGDRLLPCNFGLSTAGGTDSLPTDSEDSSSTIGADQATSSLNDPEVYSDY
jgi:hypothetical protein